MSKKLQGKVAVITGGNSGIGLATARRFVAEGAHVFITGRRQAELDEAVRQIGQNVTGVPGDVSNLADLDRLFATVTRQQGRIDVLFANAGFLALARSGRSARNTSTSSSPSTSRDCSSPCRRRCRSSRTADQSF